LLMEVTSDSEVSVAVDRDSPVTSSQEESDVATPTPIFEDISPASSPAPIEQIVERLEGDLPVERIPDIAYEYGMSSSEIRRRFEEMMDNKRYVPEPSHPVRPRKKTPYFLMYYNLYEKYNGNSEPRPPRFHSYIFDDDLHIMHPSADNWEVDVRPVSEMRENLNQLVIHARPDFIGDQTEKTYLPRHFNRNPEVKDLILRHYNTPSHKLTVLEKTKIVLLMPYTDFTLFEIPLEWLPDDRLEPFLNEQMSRLYWDEEQWQTYWDHLIFERNHQPQRKGRHWKGAVVRKIDDRKKAKHQYLELVRSEVPDISLGASDHYTELRWVSRLANFIFPTYLMGVVPDEYSLLHERRWREQADQPPENWDDDEDYVVMPGIGQSIPVHPVRITAPAAIDPVYQFAQPVGVANVFGSNVPSSTTLEEVGEEVPTSGGVFLPLTTDATADIDEPTPMEVEPLAPPRVEVTEVETYGSVVSTTLPPLHPAPLRPPYPENTNIGFQPMLIPSPDGSKELVLDQSATIAMMTHEPDHINTRIEVPNLSVILGHTRDFRSQTFESLQEASQQAPPQRREVVDVDPAFILEDVPDNFTMMVIINQRRDPNTGIYYTKPHVSYSCTAPQEEPNSEELWYSRFGYGAELFNELVSQTDMPRLYVREGTVNSYSLPAETVAHSESRITPIVVQTPPEPSVHSDDDTTSVNTKEKS